MQEQTRSDGNAPLEPDKKYQFFLFFSAKIRIFVLQFYLKTLIKSWLFAGGKKSKLHDSIILHVSFTTEFLLDHQAHTCMF